jgi:hypothetical protein
MNTPLASASRPLRIVFWSAAALFFAGNFVNLVDWWRGSPFAWWNLAHSFAGMALLVPFCLDASLTKTRWVLAISAMVLSVVAMIGVVSNGPRGL